MLLTPAPLATLPPPLDQVVDFKHGSVHRVLVVSYETLRKHSAELAGTVELLVGCVVFVHVVQACRGAGCAACGPWASGGSLGFLTSSLPSCCAHTPGPQVCDEGHRLKSAAGNKTIRSLPRTRG